MHLVCEQLGSYTPKGKLPGPFQEQRVDVVGALAVVLAEARSCEAVRAGGDTAELELSQELDVECGVEVAVDQSNGAISVGTPLHFPDQLVAFVAHISKLVMALMAHLEERGE